MQLSERTRGLIGARELGLMKPTAFLINTSRGHCRSIIRSAPSTTSC
jgi:phosphoglycerate dehydrogenase-like enzyme